MQEKDEKYYGFDRSYIPYDAMGDYSVFIPVRRKEEETLCEDQVRTSEPHS